jgi:hypothetical protein
MKHITFYHKDTGILHPMSIILSDDVMVEANTPKDHIPIDHPEGKQLDPLSQRVDVATGKVVDYQPDKPSADHEWNTETRRWQLNQVVQAKIGADKMARQLIAKLESSQHRLIREITLGMGTDAVTKLKTIDTQIADLRKSLL